MISYRDFVDFKKDSNPLYGLPLDPLRRAMGRPRAMLEIGAPAGDVPAAASAGRPFDVLLISSGADGSDLDALLAAHLGGLEDEGHVVVRLRSPFDAEDARQSVERAGLQFLRIEKSLLVSRLTAPSPPEQSLLVARRRPRPRPLSLTVGMLTMNEEESIARMMAEIRRVAPDALILCVDSSTKDRTHLIAEEMGARVVRQLPPRGHGPAMEVLMYEAARQSDALIYLDCDYTYPPDMIPVIRRLLEEGVDVVNASRTTTRPAAMPLINYAANKSFALTARGLYGVPASDLHSGMRGYRSSVIRAFAFDGEGDALPIDTLLWPARCGYDVVEFPINYQERIGVSKLRKVAGTVWTFIRLGKTFAVGERRPGGYRVLERAPS